MGGGMRAARRRTATARASTPLLREARGPARAGTSAWSFSIPSRASTTPRKRHTFRRCSGFGVIPATPTPTGPSICGPPLTKTVTARCPSVSPRSGGFQRHRLPQRRGDYVTESRASARTLVVRGHAYGTGSGQLTSIAYCARNEEVDHHRGCLLPRPVAAGGSASTTTPTCPAGQKLIAGGFSNQRLHQHPLRRRRVQLDGHLDRPRLRLLRRGAAVDRVRLLPAGEGLDPASGRRGRTDGEAVNRESRYLVRQLQR